MEQRARGRNGERRAVERSPRKTAVITDDGNRVGLVLLDPGRPMAVGSRFDHQGRTWVIRGRRHPSRVLVAEPLIPRKN